MTTSATGAPVRSAGALVLATLAAGQFVMTLDSTVMNVSMVQVADDVGTTITGIQTAITAYTLVMAAFMITGGKIGQIIGPKRAFIIGCVVYAAGSLTTAISQSLPVLLLGWSLLEGLGAALIMPALVALVASNFESDDRPRAYGMLAAASAIAVAAGPLIGGLCTTYLSWRVVFVGEVVAIGFILVVARKMQAAPANPDTRLDAPGALLSASGLGLFVFGLLRSGEWGFVQPKTGGPEWMGLSPSFWLMLLGLLTLRMFIGWQRVVVAKGREPLVDPELLANAQLRAGLGSFFFQFLVQGGLFFLISLYLTAALGLSAIATGVRLMPLSISLLLAATVIPKRWPQASPRFVSRVGFASLVVAVVLLITLLNVGTGPEIVTWPLLLAGFGIGALASQLGAVTVAAVPDERAGEVGGLQNTSTNLGASIATALCGAVLISTLTTGVIENLDDNPAVPASVVDSATTELAAGVPFLSDEQLSAALTDAGVEPALAQAVMDANEEARIQALQVSLAVLALMASGALLVSGRLPSRLRPAPERPPAPVTA